MSVLAGCALAPDSSGSKNARLYSIQEMINPCLLGEYGEGKVHTASRDTVCEVTDFVLSAEKACKQGRKMLSQALPL